MKTINLIFIITTILTSIVDIFTNAAIISKESSGYINIKKTFIAEKPLEYNGTQIRKYDFNVANKMLAPDGYMREMTVINGEYPGPTIHVNKGDKIIVNVTNAIGAHCTIHWHGLFQTGTNWFDGVPGISQCPIPNEKSYSYEFETGSQKGTFWYHSHFSTQAVDGMVGAFIVHDPEDPYINEYDEEFIINISDHFHTQSGKLIALRLQPNYTGFNPVPDAGLINGATQIDCSKLKEKEKENCDTKNGISRFIFEQGKTYRLRIINFSAESPFTFSIDGHLLKIIEVEGTYVEPNYVSHLYLNVAQRYSVIVKADQRVDTYWMRANRAAECLVTPNNQTINFDSPINNNVTALIQYDNAPLKTPVSEMLPYDNDFLQCEDPSWEKLRPSKEIEKDLPSFTGPATSLFNFQFKFGVNLQNVSLVYVNNVSFIPHLNLPTVQKLFDGINPRELAKSENKYLIASNGTVDVIIVNDNGAQHPFHLHGHKFGIITEGYLLDGKPTFNETTRYNFENPVIRDTASVPPFKYFIIRFNATNPGVWPLHCHIKWHIEMGMLIQFIERPDDLLKLEYPIAARDLCHGIIE
ncbi:2066_t:CDS:2 [Entrophospora sp. SA101]|nr:10972_t:CDS:2 [Entrophospora sp. SA101]CAJ0757448.1 23073_t:CDS:2 [Entrophospora sp. SA101]CAJ0768207.1 2066_t:CDS:2 [Entrophospora sp. SA101]CAJ0824089.1 19572_t:CDS:2 [Entrophospora sp. SA101]CAJ0836718.1 18688_t:CDS:2 [Entrophospora sp. SA101]